MKHGLVLKFLVILLTGCSLVAAVAGVAGIVADMGDFAPLALEGKILQIVPRHNLALADHFVENVSSNSRTVPMGQIVSSRGRFAARVPLLGAELMYYGRATQNN